MLAGIMQIRSPSGSNGLYIPKINPGMKKAACISTSCFGGRYIIDWKLSDTQFQVSSGFCFFDKFVRKAGCTE